MSYTPDIFVHFRMIICIAFMFNKCWNVYFEKCAEIRFAWALTWTLTWRYMCVKTVEITVELVCLFKSLSWLTKRGNHQSSTLPAFCGRSLSCTGSDCHRWRKCVLTPPCQIYLYVHPWHIEAEKSWLPFPRYFQIHFLEWKCMNFYGPKNNILALVQIMAWRRPGDETLSDPMMVSLLTHICVTWPQRSKLNSMARP